MIEFVAGIPSCHNRDLDRCKSVISVLIKSTRKRLGEAQFRGIHAHFLKRQPKMATVFLVR